MNEGQRRSARITRRTFGAMGLAIAAVAAVRLWPEDPLQALVSHENAAGLKALGQLPAVKALGDVEAKLKARLNAAASYDEAVANDALNGAFVVLDGWHVPETTALAAAWLARQG
ncbi:MAG: hypothetical protein QM698_13550 [Micropepsaceae bacterium]